MKKLDKVLSVIMIVLTLACIGTTVFADNTVPNVLDTLNGQADIGNAGTTMGNIGNKILTFITIAAMILAVVLVAVLGIKYMMGSTEEKAEYKKSMIPYLVGAVLVFGAGAIGKVVVNFASSIQP